MRTFLDLLDSDGNRILIDSSAVESLVETDQHLGTLITLKSGDSKSVNLHLAGVANLLKQVGDFVIWDPLAQPQR